MSGEPPDQKRVVTIVALLAGALALGALGCDSDAWHPAAPSGVTYEYASQGFKGRNTTAFGGLAPGVAFGGAFSFREKQGLVNARGKDPFAESMPINGVHFNEHLAGRGVKLDGDAAPIAPAGRP